MTRPERCVWDEGELKGGTTSIVGGIFEGHTVVVKEVPCWHCTRCRQSYIEPDTSTRIHAYLDSDVWGSRSELGEAVIVTFPYTWVMPKAA
ncbi:YgiT-type zinc finger protein [Patescibacteria group bacterium]|nr:YgiT-type zinc finger protein [Patescibacteria group bacterium]